MLFRSRRWKRSDLPRRRDTRHRLPLDDCDSVPQESLTDSPPNEFNFSDDEWTDHNEYQPMNFVETMPHKASNEQCLIDAFATTSLHVLEIKCNDPQVSERNLDVSRALVILLLVLLFEQCHQRRTRSHPSTGSVPVASRSARGWSPATRGLVVFEKSESMASDRFDDAEHRSIQRSESQSAARTSFHRGLDGEIQRLHLSTARVRQWK